MTAAQGWRQFTGSRFLLLPATVMALVLGSCSRSNVNADGAKLQSDRIVLRGAGATFPSSLLHQWFASYPSEQRLVQIEYSPVGSGQGVRRFGSKNLAEHERADFGMTDSPLPDGEPL